MGNNLSIENFRIHKENFAKAVDAIERDDVDAFKEVLKVLPQFITMVYKRGWNFLYISCQHKKKKIFDYLLDLNCFDLEAVNYGYKRTILEEALCHSRDDYFGVKLIHAGADVYKIFSTKKTSLHYAITHNLCESVKLLLQKGLDPNARDNYHGYTPLVSYLQNSNSLECLDLLLEYGADTSICYQGYLPFELAVVSGNDLFVQEQLFHFTFDSHSDNTIKLTVWRKLIVMNSPLFDNVMDIVSDVIGELDYVSVNFFVIQPEMLKRIVEKCDYILEEDFAWPKGFENVEMNIDNMEILLNSRLHFETVELISRLNLKQIYCQNRERMSEEELSSLILYLLSYGLKVTSCDCRTIYKSEGCSDLFKILLPHLNYVDRLRCDAPIANIIADIHCDLDTIIRDFCYFSSYKLKLLDFFANPGLKLLYESSGEPNLINKVKQLPRVPSLLQLARDETRRHIIKRYNLRKTSQYYWVLRRLEIGTIYEEILTFETELYG